jgi:hypothetical protein
MVVLWNGNTKLATVADADLMDRLLVVEDSVTLKDESGKVLGKFTPAGPPIPWEPETTLEDLDRELEKPGIPYEEVKRRLGWE